MPEEEKLEILNKAKDHMMQTAAEREEYKRIQKLAKASAFF